MSWSNIRMDEEKFHDQWAQNIDPATVLVEESFTSCTAPEARQIVAWLGDIKGKKILDLGCGAGEAAVYFAKQGAMATAADLSEKMLRVTQQVADRHGVSIATRCCPAHDTGIPGQSFDIVYAANLLHHTDMDKTLSEIKRLLQPGGVAVFWDPLRHNPLINLYRRIAYRVRTADEHPLTWTQVSEFKKHFSTVHHQSFWFLTLWIFIYIYLIERVNPNQERYWKKIIQEHKRWQASYVRLEKLDTMLLKTFPYLQRFCWNIAIYCRND